MEFFYAILIFESKCERRNINGYVESLWVVKTSLKLILRSLSNAIYG